MKLLLVEDDAELAQWLIKALKQRYEFMIDWADDGTAADQRLRQEEFDAVILDLGLPKMGGRAVLSAMRVRGDNTPALILTARDTLSERIGTLHEGADDFLAKPFAIEELEARLVALVRRAHGRNVGTFSCGDLTYYSAEQRFTLCGDPLDLTPREHSLLRILVQHAGEPMSKQKIVDRMFSYDADIQLEAIEVIAHRLRKKLSNSVQIRTVRGLGYVLEAGAA
ncbi:MULTISPECIES: response regulator [Rhizobium/Agrobacterium group]|uniref:response regulator n=1 Tax=Rhizobium/Agrobacterium group TaxID=227290 RepID=UPI000FD7EB5B|nr:MULTISPECIES: response regulator [Rhizobium/Agrobacterium group]MBB4401807.1 two-component system response regulator TctD [Agrobacterium radiobacter]MBB5587587.1 two-component system response regulator TctD [Agrobacterium radiobacter]RVT81008.1 response regulator [Agrobacterium sp. CNPSo 2736]TGE90278.1 DNA-binding response regulator [Rhizobium sp. SEMIA 4032]